MASRSGLLAEPVNQARRRDDPGSSHGSAGQRSRNPVPGVETLRLGTRALRQGPLIPASLRHDMIRDVAYYRAQARDFEPGRELEDWLVAEQEVDELIVRRYGQ